MQPFPRALLHGRSRPAALALCATMLAAAACDGDDGAPRAVAVPERAGDVWEADHAADRGTAPAALLAFVNGLHVLVVDGDDAYAGMTRLVAEPAGDGRRTLALANGLSAELAPVGEVMELRFSSGETLAMRRQAARVEP